jgi:hypothetical protein
MKSRRWLDNKYRSSTHPQNMIVPVVCDVLSSFRAEPTEFGPNWTGKTEAMTH